MNFIKEHKTSLGFLLFLSLLFTFSFVGAIQETSDIFPVNEQISYTKPCLNNGTWCSGSAGCNYTFYDRDNSITSNNVVATNVGSNGASLWQYNITHTNTGTYSVDMVCLDGTAKGAITLYYEVTGDGAGISLGFILIILAVSFGLIVMGLSIPDATITIFGSFGLYFTSLFILFNGIAGTKDATTTWAIGLILLGVAMYVSIRSAYELIVD